MGATPEPPKKNQLPQAGIAGVVLAIIGIGLFLAIYFGLQSAGVGDFPRLILALCVPPAAMAALIGIYMIATARKPPSDDES